MSRKVTNRTPAIPLRQMNPSSMSALSSCSRLRSQSIDSETSAILSYALGKEADDNEDDGSLSPRTSTGTDDAEAQAFFKENDPMNDEFNSFPQRKANNARMWRANFRNHDDFGYGYSLLLE